MSKIIRETKITYPTREISSTIDEALADFMGAVFIEYHKNQKVFCNSTNIIRKADDPMDYRVILYETNNSQVKQAYNAFIKKIMSMAEKTNYMPDYLQIKKNLFYEHPELKEGEILLTNEHFESNYYSPIGYKTKRYGKVAYNIDGEIIISREYYPVFVKKSEYDDHMEKENVKILYLL